MTLEQPLWRSVVPTSRGLVPHLHPVGVLEVVKDLRVLRLLVRTARCSATDGRSFTVERIRNIRTGASTATPLRASLLRRPFLRPLLFRFRGLRPLPLPAGRPPGPGLVRVAPLVHVPPFLVHVLRCLRP